MIRTLLTTTALTAMLVGGAMAQTATTTATPAPGAFNAYTATDSDNLATEIIGKQVYASAAADAEHIGDINNLVVNQDGSIQAVVIGVGGFLGIGEKNVAVPLDTVMVTEVPNSDDLKLTTTETADTLKAAPEFKTKAAQVAERNATTPVDGSTTSSTTPMAPAGNNTMAPGGGAAPAGQPATTTP
ncbi:MAG: PRC-barrel domain containing protein [Hyphomicrobiales bacterium]|nr:MAG: PRC-barrel domain containing protein [Hyphomicrobiales bacterium]